MYLVGNHHRYAHLEPRTDKRGTSRRPGVGDHELASSSVTCHPVSCNALFNDCLEVTKRAVATFLPAVVKNADQLDFDQSDVISLFKKKMTGSICDCKRLQYLRIKGQQFLYLIRECFLPPQVCDGFWSMHSMFHKAAWGSSVHLIGNAMMLVQLGDLNVGFHFLLWIIFLYCYLLGPRSLTALERAYSVRNAESGESVLHQSLLSWKTRQCRTNW